MTEGKYDPAFVFSHKGEFVLFEVLSCLADVRLDKFENIAQSYKTFNNHQVPGGLKICLATAFGREQEGK